MAINDDEVAFLDYFCDDRQDFDYAVLIDALWGSGKTYFMKNYLKRKYATSTSAKPEPPQYLWVSLFGRTSTAEIRDALFAEAHPWVSSKWATLAGTLGSAFIRRYTGVDLPDKALAKQFLPDLNAKLIVFDDLERTAIGPANALGLINGLVESGAFKAIVIGNQKPLADDGEYRSQKENVIGRTLTIMSDPDAVLSEFTKSLHNQQARDAVTANRNDILAVFRASGYHNLRSLRAALDDFDRLVTKSDRRLADARAALRELLLYLVAIGMEVRADAVQGDRLEELLGASRGFSLRREADSNMVESLQLTRKYPIVQWQSPIISPGILGRLITSGVLPLQEVNDGLAVHPLIVGAGQVPAWLALWSWKQLSGTDYKAARAALLDQLGNGSITHPGELLHVVGTLISIERFDGNIVSDVEAYFRTYIDKLRNDGTLVPEMAVFDNFNATGWSGYGYQSSDHPTFKTVRVYLQKAVISAHRMDMAEKAKELFHRLKAHESEDALYEFDRNSSKFGGVALLQNIKTSDFADILVTDSRYDLRLIAALRRRYELGNRYAELIEEKRWLTDLEAEVRRRAAEAPAPFSQLLAELTGIWFGEIQRNMEIIESFAPKAAVSEADNKPAGTSSSSESS